MTSIERGPSKPRPMSGGGGRSSFRFLSPIAAWLDAIDPGAHRRIKGLRLVTAYGIAAMLGTMPQVGHGLAGGASLSSLAGGFALWASVSEARTTRGESSRDLLLLCAAAALGAAVFILLSPVLQGIDRTGPELTLATGAFLVGYLKRFGVLGAGIGSQIFIGQLLAYGAGLTDVDLATVGAAAALAALAAIVPRVLSGPAERPVPAPAASVSVGGWGGVSPEFVAGLQAAVAALVIVILNDRVGLAESAWAITACAYVVTNSPAGTIERIRRRIVGTAIGVPLGLICLPVAVDAPLLIWAAAALAMIVYAMALPERYDIACGAYAFTLVVTLAVTGEHSIWLLAARAWETLLGGVLGLAVAMLLAPLQIARPGRRSRHKG
ncbi:FUSC family protein [Inquilinus limosus]|uniref:FUSC family protein n=1 Tax=Inquilinus limosus TaxID=171674 RepID=UPI003F172F85